MSYYEIGTALTANHAHAAMMGVYGMLAVGLALFCLRYLIPAERSGPTSWRSSRSGRSTSAWRGWCSRPCFRWASLQLCESVNNGYFQARTSNYITNRATRCWNGCGCPVTCMFIIGGVVPFLWITCLGIRHGIRATATELPPETLYVEETAEAAQDRTGLPIPTVCGAVDQVPPDPEPVRLRATRRGGAP